MVRGEPEKEQINSIIFVTIKGRQLSFFQNKMESFFSFCVVEMSQKKNNENKRNVNILMVSISFVTIKVRALSFHFSKNLNYWWFWKTKNNKFFFRHFFSPLSWKWSKQSKAEHSKTTSVAFTQLFKSEKKKHCSQ